MKPEGLLIMESDLVNPRDEDADGIRLPAIEVARELGNKMAANIVMLGYIVGATGVVSREAMEASIRESVRPAHLELDLNALDAGFNMAASKRDD
jgi:2-oxoglutarate ferredoxin oxidoreductase subunit gamma